MPFFFVGVSGGRAEHLLADPFQTKAAACAWIEMKMTIGQAAASRRNAAGACLADPRRCWGSLAPLLPLRGGAGAVLPLTAGAAVAASRTLGAGQNLTSRFGRGRGNGTVARSATVLCTDRIIG